MTPGRVVLLVLGSLVSLVALALMAGGGGLLWLHEAKRDSDGFYTTKLVGLETSTHVLASEGLDVLDVPSAIFDAGRLGEARLAVSASDGVTPVFAGVAREADAADYLAGVDREIIQGVDLDADLDRVRVEYERRDGDVVPAPPGAQDFWFESVEGPGTQVLEWDVIEGSWTVVVMNADASRGIDADATVGARVGFVLPLAIGLVSGGVVLLLIGGGLIFLGGVRRAREEAAFVDDRAARQFEDVAEGAAPAMAGEASAGFEIAPYPVSIDGVLTGEPSRWLWLVKWILLIPHFVVLFFLWIAFMATTIAAFFAILFTTRYPRGIFDFNVGVMRWTWRVVYYGYGALATDEYPPFTLEATDYPATLDVEYPERLSRGLVLVKWWLLAIPHYLVVGFFVGGWAFPWVRWLPLGGGGLIGLLAVIAAVTVLFTGRYPRDLHEFLVGLNRWSLRVAAYAGLMRDEYPPFRPAP